LLKEIQKSPDRPISEISRQVSLSQATVTSILDRLEQQGFTRRQRSEKDKRKVNIYLTEKAETVALQIDSSPQQEYTIHMNSIKILQKHLPVSEYTSPYFYENAPHQSGRMTPRAFRPPARSEGRQPGIPCYGDFIKAGFPSPAADYREEILDFNSYLVSNQAATFTVRVDGDSMEDEGIQSGDLLIVDRSMTPGKNGIVVAILYGEFTVKKLVFKEGRYWLFPGNPAYDPIRIELDMDFQVWGVVTHVIHRCIP